MTTAYAANVQYGPGAQVTSAGHTYVNSSANTVENTAPPGGPWEEVGTIAGLLVAHVADAVADGALTEGAPAALTSSAPAALTSSQNATTTASDPTTTQALANALKTSYNAAQADIAALRTTLAAVQVDVATSRTERAAVVTDVTALRTAFNAAVGVLNTLLADLQAAGLQS